MGRAVPELTARFPGADLVAETHLGNHASAAVLLGSGFHEEEPGTGRYEAPVRRFRRPS